jgi:predicted AlkP superfamily phosphohydrolase/phosphomutase
MTSSRGRAQNRVFLWIIALFLCFCQPLHAYVGPGAGFAFLSSFLVLIAVVFVAILSILAWPFRFIYWLIKGQKAYGLSNVNKLIIVGLDGMDPVLTEKYMAQQKLPNLAQLRKQGTYTPLKTTTPSISPVAWSSFMTGVNPSKHNIFDFLSRDPKSYLPELSSAHIGKPRKSLSLGKLRIPLSKPEIRGMRKSVPFWKILGDHRVFSTVLRVPITFPPEKFKGHLLSGMCTPDLKGTQGSFSFYTSDFERAGAMEGGTIVTVRVNKGQVETYLSGPENTFRLQAGEMKLDLNVRLFPDTNSAILSIDSQQIHLKKGEFSEWIRLTFKPGLGMKVRCICRFLIKELDPHFEMYVTPLNIDPERPALPISYPIYYSMYLSKLLGRFVTLGLANDTWALNEGALSEEAFLELAYAHHEEWEKIFFNGIAKTRRGVVACVFETTDSIQHMFFRYLDPSHPAMKCNPSPMGPQVIEKLYVRMDELVGKVLKTLDEKSVLIVMSDHGFKSFRRGMNLNSWLLRQGYLTLKDGELQSAEWFRGVDWTKTQAYALGLGGIYLNMKGREASGIVGSGDEARALKRELIEKLKSIVDEETGLRAINNIFDRDQLYTGPYKENAPDLIVGYSEGYRASWDGVKGAVGADIFSDNNKCWSGDHCIDSAIVPGVLFCSRKLAADNPGIWDIAPTVLDLFGVPIPAYMDGKSLLNKTTGTDLLESIQ